MTWSAYQETTSRRTLVGWTAASGWLKVELQERRFRRPKARMFYAAEGPWDWRPVPFRGAWSVAEEAVE